MIVYDFHCDNCDTYRELRLHPMKDDLQKQSCHVCHSTMRRVFSATPHRISFRYGFHGNVNRGFDSQHQRDEHYKRNNLVRVEPEQAYESATLTGAPA